MGADWAPALVVMSAAVLLVGEGLAGANDPHGGLAAAAGDIRRGDDDGAAAVGDHAAVEEVEGVGDHAGADDVFDGGLANVLEEQVCMPLTASGLRMAWARVAVAISASCSLVVPYSCMWRVAAMAYMAMSVAPQGRSMLERGSGVPTPPRNAVPVWRAPEAEVEP